MATKSVAVIEVLDDACILALATGGTGVAISDFSRLDVPGCSVAANSVSRNAIDLRDTTSSIVAAALVTRGEVSFQANPIDPAAPPPEFVLTSRPMIGAPRTGDPYAATLTHAFLTRDLHGPAAAVNSWISTAATIHPGLYDGGMRFQTSAVIDLTPGLYYVANGDFSVASDATITCNTCSGASGVSIILTTTAGAGEPVGSVHISNSATVTLQAPNSGAFSGLMFVQDPLARSRGSDTPDNAFDGGPRMNLTGLLYFPNTAVGFYGNPSSTCTFLIAKRVTIDGHFNINASGCEQAGITRLPTVYTAGLAE
jgi:hypothetical protein